MSLVEQIFKLLLAHYGGGRMAAAWQGSDPGFIKSYWADRIGALTPGQVGYALRYLPQHPPTVDEFRAVAFRYRPEPPPLPLLGSPKNDEHGRARIAEIAERFGSRAVGQGDAA